MMLCVGCSEDLAQRASDRRNVQRDSDILRLWKRNAAECAQFDVDSLLESASSLKMCRSCSAYTRQPKNSTKTKLSSAIAKLLASS